MVIKNVYDSKEEYLNVVNAWKLSHKETGNDTLSTCVYHLLRGHDWRKGLAKNTNLDLANNIYCSLVKSAYLPLSPFKGTVTEKEIAKFREKEIPQWEV